MKKLGLYVVTDGDILQGRDFIECVEATLRGGVHTVQLREKNCDGKEFLERAQQLRALTKKYGATFIVNDRVDIALAVDADGVHVGQSDIPASVVRQLVGPTKIVGVSARNIEEAVQAERDGANYIGVGAMFPTSTKTDAEYVTFPQLHDIMNTVRIPTVVIGGISLQNVHEFQSYQIDGIALVSALLGFNDIEATTKEWKRVWESLNR